ncbi:hypothetical protein SARC_04335 [Sphaeroforma arctica JP610]|uniref:Uncharacterized protein n=1 Tax=Sphaeroforma arctica JP610 TaxID=667725 RepID=A0A0L0G577_9EUKA|nr:hypothetical protein SARC_04335 [Sphaeroforma arctica JP610]KNC83418.1 hypothetical protein SARC_04335 [Sphaeroforma arctica JP610]|eukprot:XP_014157320.1 hypothetical protein SARC_04335 [Sphaeroforma arctica JP610]
MCRFYSYRRGAERGSDSNDQDFDSDSSSSGESYSGASSVDEMSEKKIKISRTTIRTEKDALLFEKALQRYGWGRWREIRRDCPKLCGNWSDFQIAAIAQEILLIAVDSKTASNDSSMVSFVKRICSEFTKQHQPAPPAQPTSHIQKTSVPIARMSTDAMPHGKSRGPVAAGVTAGGVGVTITSSVPPNMINGVAAIVNPHADSTTANPATNATTDAQALPPTQAQTVPSQHPQPHPSTHTSPILIEQANSSISLQTPPIPLSPSTTEPALAGATAIVAPVSYRPVHMQWIDTYKPLTVAAGELRKISKYRKRLHTGTIAVRLFNQLMYADWMNNTLTHRALWGKPYTMDNQLHEITLGPMLHFSPKTYKMEVCPFAEKWWRDATYDDKVCAVAMARHGYATQKVVVSNVLEDPGLGKLLASTVMKVLNKSMMASDADEPQPSTLIHELDFDHKKELEAEFMSILKHGNSSLLAHHNKRRAADRKESLAEKEARAQKELKVKAKKEKLVAVPPGNPDHWKLKDQKAFYNTAAAYGIPSTTTETKPSTSTSATTALSSTDTKAESGETPTIHVETTDSIDTNKPEEKPAPQEKEAENTEPPAVRDEKLEQDVEMSQAEVAQSLPLPTPTPDTTGNASTNTTAPISLHGDRVGGLKGGSKSPKTEEGAALAGAVGWTWTWAEFRKMAELNCTDDAVIRFWKEYKAMCEAVAAEDDQPLAATNALSGSDMDTGSPSLKEPSLASAVDEKCPPAQTINLTTPSEQPSEYIKSTAECIVASSTEPDPESKQSHKDPYTTISSLETVTTRDVPLQAAPATDHTDIQAPVPTNNNGINTTAKHFAKPKQDKTTLLWPGQFAVHKVSPYKAKALLERAALMDQLRTVVLVEPTLKHIISRIPTSGIKRFAQWFEKGADDIALYTAVAQHGWDVPHTTVLDMHKDAFKAGRKQVKSLQQVDAVTKNGLNGDCWQKLAHWPSRTDIMKRLRNIIDAIRLHRKLSSEGGIKRKTTLEFLPIRTKKPASVHLKKQSCLDFTKANSMSDHSDEEFQEPSKPLSSIESKSTISAKPAKRRKSSSSAVDCELIDMTSESPSSSADNMSKNRLSSTTSNSFPVKSTDGKTALKYKIATATQRSGDSKLSTKSSKGLKPDYKTASSEGSGADSVGIHSSKILSINSAVLNKSSTSMGAKDIKATKRTLTSRKRPEASINSSMPNGSKKAKRSEKNITLMSMFKKKPHVEVVDSSDEDGPLCVPTCYSPSPPNLY